MKFDSQFPGKAEKELFLNPAVSTQRQIYRLSSKMES